MLPTVCLARRKMSAQLINSRPLKLLLKYLVMNILTNCFDNSYFFHKLSSYKYKRTPHALHTYAHVGTWHSIAVPLTHAAFSDACTTSLLHPFPIGSSIAALLDCEGGENEGIIALIMTSPLAYEKVWFEKFRYDEAERFYFEKLAKGSSNIPLKNSLAGEVAKVRQHIQNSLECMDGIAALATNVNVEIVNRLNTVERKNQELTSLVSELQSVIKQLESRVKTLESQNNIKSAPVTSKTAPAPTPSKAAKADDDDVDLFASDSDGESESVKKVKEEAAAASKKKSKKQELIQKSIIILDVKPWDDETDMKAMEENVRKINTDGLLWGASKLVPLAYGIHKLQISCVVEDEKVSIDWLQEAIEEIQDYVQSVDIAAFNKV